MSAIFALVKISSGMEEIWTLQSDSMGGLLKEMRFDLFSEGDGPVISISTTGDIDNAAKFCSIGDAMSFISTFSEQARLHNLSTSLGQILSFKVMRFLI